MEGNASAPVLYMALELSNKTWRLALSDGVERRQVSVPAGELLTLAEAVAKAKERFGLAREARVLSGYEAGLDGFWLDRHLRSEVFLGADDMAPRVPPVDSGIECGLRGKVHGSDSEDDS